MNSVHQAREKQQLNDVSSQQSHHGSTMCWKVDSINLDIVRDPQAEVETLETINFADTIGKAPRGRPVITTVNDGRLWLPRQYNQNDKNYRSQVIAHFFSAACAAAGFDIHIRGWCPSRNSLRFECKRSRRYEDKVGVKRTRRTSTTKPTDKNEQCPFSFVVYWEPTMERWYVKEKGPGVNTHKGHERELLNLYDAMRSGDKKMNSPVVTKYHREHVGSSDEGTGELAEDVQSLPSSEDDVNNAKTGQAQTRHQALDNMRSIGQLQISVEPDPIREGFVLPAYQQTQHFSILQGRQQLDALYNEVVTSIRTPEEFEAVRHSLLRAKDTVQKLAQKQQQQNRQQHHNDYTSELTESDLTRKRPREEGSSSSSSEDERHHRNGCVPS